MLPCKKKTLSKNLLRIQFKSYKILHIAPFESFRFYSFITVLSCPYMVKLKETEREPDKHTQREREREDRLGVNEREKSKKSF